MPTEDHVRLAWEADRQGHAGLRDAMLTLAVVENAREPWAERGRSRLVKLRPDHFLAGFPGLREALDDARVLRTIDNLRRKYPLVRVRWMLLRAQATAGPYSAEVLPLDRVIRDLIGAPAGASVRRDAAEPARGPTARGRVLQPADVAVAYQHVGYAAASAHDVGPNESAERVAVETSPAQNPPRVDPEREKEEQVASHYLAVLVSIALLIETTRLKDGRGRDRLAA